MAGFVQNVSFQSPEMEAIAHRQKLAEALQAQSQQPIQSAAPNAPISWTQGLAKMMQAYTARKGLDKAETERKALVDQMEQRRSADTSLLAQALQGRQVRPAGLEGDVAGNIYQQDALPAQTPMQSLSQALPMMRDPQLQQAILGAMVGHLPKRPEPFTMKPGEVRYDENGKPMAFGMSEKPTEAKPFSLAPGHTQYDASGKPIVSAPDKPQDQIPVTPVDLVGEDGRIYKVDARTGRKIGLSAADTKLTGAFNADTSMLNNSVSDMDRLATAANELLQHRGLGGITGLRGALPNVPGSAAADAQAKLDTLKSQVGFGVLQNMRNNSKTGGALGQVSDTENKLLQANLAALANAQSEEQMRESLQKIISYTEGAKDRLRSAFNMKHGDNRQQQQPAYTGPERRTAPQGFSIVR